MKVFTKKALIFLVIVELLLFPLISCSKGETRSTDERKTTTDVTEEITIAETDEQIKETEILTPVQKPKNIEGIITYYSGEVSVFEGGEWYDVEIGDFVTEKNVIKVDQDSFCEIQFGNTAVVKIQQNSEINLARISLEPGNAHVALDMQLGNVLCKVQKLTGTESFKIKTQTAVCGVRGTEFSVSASKEADTILAVKKGAVSVLPKSVDIDKLKEKVADKGDAVRDAISKIEEAAPVVRANEEITLDQKVFDKTEKAAGKIEKAVDEIAAGETAVPEKEAVDKLNRIINEQKNEFVKPVEKPKEISKDNIKNLQQVEHMKMIAITAVVTDETADKPAEPAIMLHKVSIDSLTGDALIKRNGRLVGKTSFSGIFKEGEVLSFNITKEGYEPYNMKFTVTENTARLYKVELNKLPENEKEIPKKEISINTVPPSATIFVNEVNKGTGTFKTSYDEGTLLNIRVENTGYDNKLLEIKVNENSEEIYEVMLEKSVKTVSVSVLPSDSAVIFNGKKAGTGKASFDFVYGDNAVIKFSRNGYKNKTLELNIDNNTKPVYSVRLEAKPVEKILSPFSKPVIKSIAYQNGRFFASDAAGNIYSADLKGNKSWNYSSGNTRNANSAPVAAGKYVFMTGANEMVTLEAATGKLHEKTALNQNTAHLFGRTIIPFKDKFIYPKNNSLTISSFTKGSAADDIKLSADLGMSPAVWNGNIVIADQEGTVHIIDPVSKKTTGSIKTTALQPIALSITVKGNKGYFANRKGKTAAVDFSSKTLLWEKKIDEEKINIFSDLVVNKDKVYVFTGNNIHTLSASTGEEAGAAIQAASPPACRGNYLYFGKPDGSFSVYSCSTGIEVKNISLNHGKIKTRPVFADGMILAGTDKGKILVLNPEGFEL